jgi:Domain of unknown function (DUF6398)
MVVGMGTTTQPALHIVSDSTLRGDTLTPASATTTGIMILRRTLNQENAMGKLVRDLAAKVGGLPSLESLSSEPLPDEPFAIGLVNEVDRPFATETIALFDEQCDKWLDVEYRTIGRRLFARAMVNQPTLTRRSSSTIRFAAALAHAVLAANDRIGRVADGHLRGKDIAEWFGVSSAGDAARRIVEAARFERPYDDDGYGWRYGDDRFRTPSPDFLHSSARARLLAERERTIAVIDSREHALAGRRPTVNLHDGMRGRRGSLADVVTVRKATTQSGQTMLVLGLAPLVPNPELEIFVLDLAEAGLLADRLGAALAAPTPGDNRIGQFDDIDDLDDYERRERYEPRYLDHFDSRYWR